MSEAKKTARLIDGKKIAEQILLDLAKEINQLPKRPGLATILVGEDPSSQLYINNKKKASQKTGIEFHEYLCNKKCYPNISQKELLEMIDWLNNDPEIDGIIIQLPLPKKYNTQAIINQISPAKDADAFHPKNKGKFLTDVKQLTPPLINAIKIALAQTKNNLKDKKTIIVAKDSIFSNSLDQALKKIGLKVTVVRPNEKDLKAKTNQAEILISIVGKKHLIKPEMVKPKAIVIDAGTVLEANNSLVGDVDPRVAKVADWLTPVPGGIGPLTVAMLLKNVVELAKKK